MNKNLPEAADEHEPMTYTEQAAWWALFLIPLAALIYFVVVLPGLAAVPVGEISWQVPMIVAILASIIGIILGTIGSTIVSAIRTREAEPGSDVRSRQIERHGERVSSTIAATGAAGVLLLAMVGAEYFWIGNAVYVLGVIGAIAGSIVKIRAYRGVFRE